MKDKEKCKKILEQGIDELFHKPAEAAERAKDDIMCRVEFDYLMSIGED